MPGAGPTPSPKPVPGLHPRATPVGRAGSIRSQGRQRARPRRARVAATARADTTGPLRAGRIQLLQLSLTTPVSTPPLKRQLSPGRLGWLPLRQYVVVVEDGLLEMLISTFLEPFHFIPGELWK